MALPGQGAVHGEVYGVDAEGLARIDRLEGYPRLYDRRPMALEDGRLAWVYLGRARQVRHVPAIPAGRWNGRCLCVAALACLALAGAWGLPPAQAEGAAPSCTAWQMANGPEKAALGNTIGAAH